LLLIFNLFNLRNLWKKVFDFYFAAISIALT